MRTPLYLHIGHPKAASSTIQSALVHNIDALREGGFLVADTAMQFPKSGPLDGSPVDYIAAVIERNEEGLNEAVARFHQLGDHLGDRFDKVVVSAESLCIPQAEYLARALKHAFAIHVVYYIRRQDDWLVSAWNQWGCREGLGLADYCERALQAPHPNFAKVIGRWQPVADTVRVRPLHASALVGGDVVTDFFAAISADIANTQPRQDNASMDLALLDVFASSPFLFDSIHDRRLADWLRDVLPSEYAIEKATLGATVREQIRDQFAEQNRELHQRYFPDADYDQVFGPAKNEASHDELYEQQASSAAAMHRMRRVIGVQMGLLHDLHQRVVNLEADRDADSTS